MAGFTKIPKLQVEDLGTENTGDRIALFNSDGEVVGYMMSGDGFIPLSGTEVGKPVTGNISISTSDSIVIYAGDLDTYSRRIIFTDDLFVALSADDALGISEVAIGANSFSLYTDKLGDKKSITANSNPTPVGIIITDEISLVGLVGKTYYGANYDDNTYVQKKYVDDAIATTNATVSPLSLSDLNTAYEFQGTGFKVICPALNLIYIKSSLTTWEQFTTTTVI